MGTIDVISHRIFNQVHHETMCNKFSNFHLIHLSLLGPQGFNEYDKNLLQAYHCDYDSKFIMRLMVNKIINIVKLLKHLNI